MPDLETSLRRPIDAQALDQLFRNARTHRQWQPIPLDEALLREIYNLARLGPTSGNCCPARFLFVTTPEAKERLLPVLAEGNREKSRTAAAVAIIAYDVEFYEQLPKLNPYSDARSIYVGNEPLIHETAFRNSSLQGAYFIMAARALGVDCGPMSGFNAEQLNAEFFPDGKWKVNFVCNLGRGDAARLFPRQPRLEFEEACRVV
ncbi:MAG: malonic semialdehyde reductase [Armatimonadetes bacterium]|nr:malonic semialdehyde reductase [Armatimonadota bacterium]MDE2207856.1 malonic semialdehyde reductase [Armatimonadota bacterium]